MNQLKPLYFRWAGSSRVQEEIAETIFKEYTGVLYFSCIFLNLRPKYRVLSGILVFVVFATLSFYVWLSFETAKRQLDDTYAAILSAGLSLMLIYIMTCVLLFNINRENFIKLFKCMSEGFFNYEDEEEIKDVAMVSKKSRKRKLLLMTTIPSYLSFTAVTAASGQALDHYYGVGPNSSYVNDVYMLTPLPLWYPFHVSDDYWHLVALGTQGAAIGMAAVSSIGVMLYVTITLQTFVHQLEVLTIRIREVYNSAFKQYKRLGGLKLKKEDLFTDEKFRECYNHNLNKCAAHHIALIRSFNYFNGTIKWIAFITILTISALIASALLCLVVGGKPSVLALGMNLTFDEVIDVGVVCWLGDQIQSLSGGLHEELYRTDWVLMDKYTSKTVIIMIERSKQPICLTSAVTGTQVTWSVFGSILNSAYSYVNLLRAAR